jgi:hypothetical protein
MQSTRNFSVNFLAWNEVKAIVCYAYRIRLWGSLHLRILRKSINSGTWHDSLRWGINWLKVPGITRWQRMLGTSIFCPQITYHHHFHLRQVYQTACATKQMFMNSWTSNMERTCIQFICIKVCTLTNACDKIHRAGSVRSKTHKPC